MKSSNDTSSNKRMSDIPSPPERGTRGEAVIAVIDVGKTNKKLFLFDDNYNIVYERSDRFTEAADEDGFPCENLESLSQYVYDSIEEVLNKEGFEIKAVHFSTYGASFVYVDEKGAPVAPLYNYLKPYPEWLKQQFYQTYGGEEQFSSETASPVLGSLNSGMQIYRVKYEQPELFKKIKYALHLPQYLSYLLTENFTTDITSIGCHTNLWNFNKGGYHEWIAKEGIAEKLAPVYPCENVFNAAKGEYKVGIGLHDSSAALIPYLVSFEEHFLLISTGTWCISLNPFNPSPLTPAELQLDCLSYLQYQGKPVKASRLFAGNEHEEQTKRIAEHFSINKQFYKDITYISDIMQTIEHPAQVSIDKTGLIFNSLFGKRDLHDFDSEIHAYHQLMQDIITQQKTSTELIMNEDVKRIFVDGGFANNSIYMNLLSQAFPQVEVFAASMAQATALGSALAIHHSWNEKQIPSDLIQLKYYSHSKQLNRNE